MTGLAAAAPDPGVGWWAFGIALLVAIGGISGVVAVLNLPKMRRKIDADTADVLTSTAMSLVNPLREQIEQLGRRVALLEADKVRHLVLLREHSVWDDLVYERARESGLDVPKPPPLFPPL